jgi:plasmid stability protein
MKTLTLSGLSDELHAKLAQRASEHALSLEEEAIRCLHQSLDEDEALLTSLPAQRWAGMEQSLADALHETASDVTAADFQRYRNLARTPDHSLI